MKLPTLNRYTYAFAFLNFVFLCCAIVVIVVISGWKSVLSEPDQLNSSIYTRMTVNTQIINAGFIFAGAAVVTVISSLWTLLTSPTKENAATRPLGIYLIIVFNAFLITMSIATIIWFSTLRERALFFPVWKELSLESQRFIQDDLKCCGWFNATAEGFFKAEELGFGFCAKPDQLVKDPDPNVVIGCVDKIDSKGDFILNTTFTTMYGFTGVELALFLAAACIANLRMQQKRFLRIDYKLRSIGKGGFV